MVAYTFDDWKPYIHGTESGGDYDALFGYANRAGGQFAGVKPSQMTIGEVLNFNNPSGAYGQSVKNQLGYTSTPVGGYQIVNTTLNNMVNRMGLDPNQKFDPAMQERIAREIFKVQGKNAWEGLHNMSAPTMEQYNNSRQRGGGSNMVYPMKNIDDEQQQQQGFMGRNSTTGLNPLENFAAALDPLIMPEMRAGGQIRATGAKRAEKMATSKDKNRTADWLASNGRQDLAELVRGGMMSGSQASTAFLNGRKPVKRNTAVVGDSLVDVDTGRAIFTDGDNAGGGVQLENGEIGQLVSTHEPSGTAIYRITQGPNAGQLTSINISGGKTAVETKENQTKRAKGAAGLVSSASVVLDDIARIRGIIENDGAFTPSATSFGSLLKKIPNTDAFNVNSIAQSILSNIGFDRLDAMRNNSATGGALGNVSNAEIDLLQSNLGKLDQGLNEEEYLKTLNRIQQSYVTIMEQAAQVPEVAQFITDEDRKRFSASLSNAQGVQTTAPAPSGQPPIRFKVISQ